MEYNPRMTLQRMIAMMIVYRMEELMHPLSRDQDFERLAQDIIDLVAEQSAKTNE
jgi:hypothetical protein